MAWLDLRRLTYFRAIVEAGAISEAARRLSVPQPALSYHLKELEADFGGPLLVRSRSGISLTPGGQLLLDHATIILAQVARAETELRQFRVRGPADPRVLRISALPSLSTALTPQLLQRAAGAMPLAGLYVVEAKTHEARELLKNGEVDVALTIADDGTPADRWIAAESLLLVMAADHPDRETGPIRLAEALAEPLMLPARGQPVRTLVEACAQRAGTVVRTMHEIDGPSPRKQAALAGLGRTFLPWIAIRDEVEAGALRYREVIDPPLARHVAFETREGLEPEIAETLHHILTDILGELLH